MSPRSDHPRTAPEHARVVIERRLAGLRGAEIGESGQLAETVGEWARGAVYVEIIADSVASCEMIEDRLRSIARLPQATWDCGWELREAGPTGWRFAIRVYPELRPQLRAA